MIVEIGEWLPDLPDLLNPGAITAKNVYPSAGGYSPFWAAATTGLSVSGTVLGAQTFYRTDGTEVICVGTSSDLYVIVGGAVNASSLGLSGLDTAESWQFEQFGLQVYATMKSGDTYYLTTIDSDVAFSAAPGGPPDANCLARIDDFLVFGDLTDIDSSDAPYRIRWSPFNSPDGTYGTDLATQTGFVDAPGRYGKITGLSGVGQGLVMQERGVSVMDYTGSASAFEKQVISDKIGCVSPASVVDVGTVTYWLSAMGFAASDGSGVELISSGKCWDWFLKTANTENLHKVQATVNWDRRCIIWNFYQVDTTAYNAQVIYNFDEGRFSYAFQTYDWLHPATYDGAFGENDPRLRRIIGGFSSGTLYEFSGTPIEATLETGERQFTPGRHSFLSEVHPLIEETTGPMATKVSVKSRNLPGGTKAATSSATVGALGFIGVNVDAKYIGVELTIPAGTGWDNGHSIDLNIVPSGVT